MNPMPTTIPIAPEERIRMIQAFYNLPQEEHQKFQAAWKHLRFLMVLWGLDDLSADHSLILEEKRHVLLAYKSLQMLWFYRLPKTNQEPFKLCIRDRLPEDQGPDRINEAFAMSLEELTIRCRGIRRPKWMTRDIKAVKASIEALPYEAS
jgi:hypothetical protein